MKKLIQFIVVCFTCCIAFPFQSNASHAAGAELTYVWKSDSTYTIIYHFYRDCSGITVADSTSLCYYNTCDGIAHTTFLKKVTTIHGGLPNGTDLWTNCPAYPDACHGGTIPGFQEWWYAKDITLPVRCNEWVFAHTESARNGAIKNITADNLYVQATLNNELAQGNSSAFFALKPVIWVCMGVPYTYSTGPMDINGDSLYFESVTPLTSGSDCGPAAAETYLTGYSLPSNPLACSGTFVTDHHKGQVTFTASGVGEYSLAERITEYRYIHGSWQSIGRVTRDMVVFVGSCTIQPATISANVQDTVFHTCAKSSLNFCFDVKGADTSARLLVTDNAALFGGAVSYTNIGMDSVHGCFAWTPDFWDTGMHSLLVTVRDSSCNGPISVPNTFVIPISIAPVTTIVNDTNALCVGDSVILAAVGGKNFIWNVLPGGSSVSSLSCTACNFTVAKPTVTTTYTVQADAMLCGNKDTVTVTVRSTPFTPFVSLTASPNTGVFPGTTVTYTATVTKGGLLPVFEWFENGTLIPGATSNVYVTNTVTPADVIKVLVHSSAPCVNPDTASASAVVLAVDELTGNAQAIKLYPSPNNGSFSIVGNIAGLTANKATITIVNITGQLVYSTTAPVNNGRINTQLGLSKNLSAGIYTLQITSGDQTYHLKFAIQR